MAEITSQDLTHEILLQNVPRMQVGAFRQPALGGIPLLAKIGQGEGGAVYRAVHPTLDCEVAVKVMQHSADARSERFGIFLAQARQAMSVESPRLVKVFDAGTEADVFYQVMEYVEGRSAQTQLAILRERLKPGMDEPSVLELCIAATEGLAAAHAADFVHRDIRPSAIMIPKGQGDEGDSMVFAEAKLADLGLAFSPEAARLLEDSPAQTGTPGYMSPEEAVGSKDVSPASDVFSLGATMYGLLVGQPPFGGPNLSVVLSSTVIQESNDLRTWRPDVSRATARVVEGCLKKAASARFPNGAVLLQALRLARAAFNQSVEKQAEAVKAIDGLLPAVARLDPAVQNFLQSNEAPVDVDVSEATEATAQETAAGDQSQTDVQTLIKELNVKPAAAKTSMSAAVEVPPPPGLAPEARESIPTEKFGAAAQEWEDPYDPEKVIDAPRKRGLALPLLVAALIVAGLGFGAWKMGYIFPKQPVRVAGAPPSPAPGPVTPGATDPAAAEKDKLEKEKTAADAKAKDDEKAKLDAEAAKAKEDEGKRVADAAAAAKEKEKQDADKAEADKAEREKQAAADAAAKKQKEEEEQRVAAEKEKEAAKAAAEAKTREQEAEKQKQAEAAIKAKQAEEAAKADAAALARADKEKQEAERKRAEAAEKEKAEREAKAKAERDARVVQTKAPQPPEPKEPKEPKETKEPKVNPDNTAAAVPAALPHDLTVDLGNGISMDFVLATAGTFQMGTDAATLREIVRKAGADEKDFADEVPAHRVEVGAYYIARTPVTVGQFRAFVSATQYHTAAERRGEGYTLADHKFTLTPGASWMKPGFTQSDDHPVVNVNWRDCNAFCEWASKQCGKKLRLPSEAEWEYASRGPASNTYPWGNAWDGRRANHSDDTFRPFGPRGWTYSSSDDGFAFTSPVGAFKNASWCGALDMAGNVFQWCQDAYAEYPQSPTTPEILSDPADTPSNAKRPVRGGSYLFRPIDCRSAARRGLSSNAWSYELGMRLAFTPK